MDMRNFEMDAVNAFNAELQSLYDVKPPISKGKMTSVTKAALKAVKLYKHVVQSVEKFIQKCKSEYKIPGLYVIDSIIRQSRHQFGGEKDVFAPRFSRNIQQTFMHLYKCPEEEKPKVIRVLNLWQKNKIFSPEVIHPLFDIANPEHPSWEDFNIQQEQVAAQAQAQAASGGNRGPSSAISSLLSSIPSFKKEVLDYDYGEDEDGQQQQGQGGGEGPSSSIGLDALGSILSNPEILRQLATLQEQIASSGPGMPPENERQRKLAELNKQEAAFDQRLAQTVARLPFAVECELPSSKETDQNSNQLAGQGGNPLLPPPFFQQIHGNDQHHHQQQAQQLLNLIGQQQQQQGGGNPFGAMLGMQGMPFQEMGMYGGGHFGGAQFAQQGEDIVEIDLTEGDKGGGMGNRGDNTTGSRGRRKRSRDRLQRSRSRSRSRRSRSRSRGRDRKRYRSRSREKDREREKERMRKGLPLMKKEYLSICSTTLWVGHLSKLVSQEDLSDTFGQYGDIVSIDLIPPRGCAFVVMNRRQDALRALDRLKNTKLQGKTITVAWAPGKGMKGKEWKDYWEVEVGVSYIPWARLRPDIPLEDFEDGGAVDEESLPDFLKGRIKEKKDKDSSDSQDKGEGTPSMISNISVPPGPGLGTPGGSGSQIMTPVMQNPNMMNQEDMQQQQHQQQQGMNSMGNHTFNIPGVGMMPMGIPVGMVPPPLGFPGLGLPGMPNMSLLPPGMIPPPHLPGLLGDMPPGALPHGHPLNFPPAGMPPGAMGGMGPGPEKDDEHMMDRNDDNRKDEMRKEGKRRSRFTDPDEGMMIQGDGEMGMSNTSTEGDSKVEDGRPVFDRLKSIAEGYGGFGGLSGAALNEKAGPSLLGSPGALLGGPPPSLRGRGGRGGFNPGGFNEGFRGGRGGHGHTPWNFPPPTSAPSATGGFEDASANPFLNPNPNPFAGNPFIQSSLTENPFEMAVGNPNNPGAVAVPESGGRGGWGGGGGGGRGGRNPWGGGEDDHFRGGRGRGGFRGRGRGRDSWEDRSGGDRENRDRDRGGGRGPERGSGERDRSDRGDRGDRDRDRGGDRRRDDRERDRSRERSSNRDNRERERRDSNSRGRRGDSNSDSRRGESRERASEEKSVEVRSEIMDENWETEEALNASAMTAAALPETNNDHGHGWNSQNQNAEESCENMDMEGSNAEQHVEERGDDDGHGHEQLMEHRDEPQFMEHGNDEFMADDDHRREPQTIEHEEERQQPQHFQQPEPEQLTDHLEQHVNWERNDDQVIENNEEREQSSWDNRNEHEQREEIVHDRGDSQNHDWQRDAHQEEHEHEHEHHHQIEHQPEPEHHDYPQEDSAPFQQHQHSPQESRDFHEEPAELPHDFSTSSNGPEGHYESHQNFQNGDGDGNFDEKVSQKNDLLIPHPHPNNNGDDNNLNNHIENENDENGGTS